jgi:uncharacterized protein YbjQ (UPF0145 family)
MIISTTDKIPNKVIAKILGITKGSTVRAKHIGKDIFAGLNVLWEENLKPIHHC